MIHRKTENTRRKNRLENYDYSGNGMYFVTICTKNRIKYLSDITWEYNNNNDAEIDIYNYIENNPVNWANNIFNQNKWR